MTSESKDPKSPSSGPPRKPSAARAQELGIDPAWADFRNFLYVVWHHLLGVSPTKAQYALAYQIQHGPQTLLLEAFRGVGKSWILATYAVWCLLWDRGLNILVLSADHSRAQDFTQFCLRVIFEVPGLETLAPKEGDRQRQDGFDVADAPISQSKSMYASGIFGRIVGGRADILILDDVEVPNTSETQGMREKLWARTGGLSALLKPEGPQRTIVLGTPQCEDTIYNRMASERGMTMMVWPALYPSLAEIGRYRFSLFPEIEQAVRENPAIAGTPTDPERFDEVFLAKARADMGASNFTLQYQLDTSLNDDNRFPLKLRDLIVMSCDPNKAPEGVIWSGTRVIKDLHNVGFAMDAWVEPMQTIGDWGEYTGGVLAIDPAGRGKDEAGYAVVKIFNGTLYLLASGGFRDGYSEATLDAFANIAKTYKVPEILVESNFGDGMFQQLMLPVLKRAQYPCLITEVRAKGQKENRIVDVLEPVMNQHRLVVHRGVVEGDGRRDNSGPPEERLRYQLFYQMTRLTKERGALANDDRIEALAMAVERFRESMALDPTSAIGDLRKEQQEREFQQFLDDMRELGYGQAFNTNRSRSWLSGTALQGFNGLGSL